MTFEDGRRVRGAVEADVCIVGAGAAGLSLALALEGSGRRVLLLESGGRERDLEVQALAEGELVGLPTDALVASRVRAFGGTTWVWGGWCRPLDPIDFERRDWVPHSGWPITREDLDPFYGRALEVCGVQHRSYDVTKWSSGPQLKDPFWENVVFLVSEGPARFGLRDAAKMEAAKDVTTMLHSTAVKVHRTDDRVTGLEVKTLAGGGYTVNAERYVLACGAVQNARLLLHSRVGNRHVGRFFMQHPEMRGVRLLAANRAGIELLGRGTKELTVGIASRVTAAAQREHRIGNTHFLLYDADPAAPGPRKRLSRLWAGRPTPDEEIVAAAIPGLLGRDERAMQVSLGERPEQFPNPDSRVLLSEKTDPLGVPLPRLDWRMTPADRRTFDVAGDLLARTLGLNNIGRLRRRRTDPLAPSKPIHGGFHHLGTTRMGSIEEGVADAHGRVHGLSNLYVAGSGLFCTSGYTNPTLTVVALSLRMAEHLLQAPS